MSKFESSLKLPRQSQVVEYMQEGKRYVYQTIAEHFKVDVIEMKDMLNKMVDEKVVSKEYRSYFLPVIEKLKVEVNPRYIPPNKELGLYDLRQHMRMAEGSRHDETGTV